jgi:hypothetical protein
LTGIIFYEVFGETPCEFHEAWQLKFGPPTKVVPDFEAAMGIVLKKVFLIELQMARRAASQNAK